MKKIALFICLFGLLSGGIYAQDKELNNELNTLKKEGRLNGDEFYYNPLRGTELKVTQSQKKGSHADKTMSSTACNCWIPRDASFQVVPFDGSGGSGPPQAGDPNYANDDWSTNPITLPFNFCLYGSNYGSGNKKLYINNNGNISFGAPYSTFSAVAFPSNQYIMVAPFWGDVETSNPGSGYVYYQLTSTHLIIQWDSVTCYQYSPGENTLTNTFQLIITDGTDSILPNGNNISFCYGDMQWTTGDASNGTNGFGGIPATVGINKGDGTNYIQISLFDHAGTNFTNPAGNPPSGVDWLDYKSFYFNSCGSSTNLPPLSTTNSNSCNGDTLTICAVGDTLLQSVSFTGPEPAQQVTVTATAPGMGSSFSVVSSTPGVTGSLTFMVNSTGLTPGYYNVSVTATDNGSPVQSTTINYVIHILNAPIPSPALTVNPQISCGNMPVTIALSNSGSYDSYIWSTGATTSSITVSSSGTVQVTVTKNGCSKSASAVAQIYSSPSINISGPLAFCSPATTTTIMVTQPVSGGTAPFIYNWDNGTASTYSLQATAGTHSVLVTDAHGCQDSASVTVAANSAPALSITSHGNLCTNSDTLVSSVTNATSYNWSPGSGSATYTYVVGAAGVYSLSATVNGCPVSATYTVSSPVTPTMSIGGNPGICSGDSTMLTVSGSPAGTYSYTWYQGASSIGTQSVQTIGSAGVYSVTGINTNTGCRSTATVTVNNYTSPTAVINGNFTYCKGHGDSLMAVPSGGSAPYQYSWSPGSATTQTINAVPPTNVASITYSVTITDANGCMAVAQQLLKQSNPHVYISNTAICLGNYVVMNANGSGTAPLTYTWTNPAGITPQQVIGKKDSIYTPGTYTVSMTDVYGCTAKDSTVIIAQNPQPQAGFSYSPASVESGSPVTFSNQTTIDSAGSIVAYYWNLGDGSADTVASPTHTYTTGGTYTVTLVVVSNKGCLDTIVEVIHIDYAIMTPNIITPNGDGINELLAFKNLEHFKNNKINIFNRWGRQLYQDNDYKNNWTGKDYNDGTYFYILEVPEKHKTYKGFFEIQK